MRKVLGVVGLVSALAFVATSVLAAPVMKQQAGQEKPKEAPKEAAATADPVTGDWDGTVDTPNGSINFGMKLKLENGKVSGEVMSPEGAVAASGTFADGKLSMSFPYSTGDTISMEGALKDGALSGEMSMAGFVMVWSAKKKEAEKK